MAQVDRSFIPPGQDASPSQVSSPALPVHSTQLPLFHEGQPGALFKIISLSKIHLIHNDMVLDRCDIRLFHCTLLIMKSSILYFKLMWHSERSERSARSFCKYSSVPPKVTAVINCSFYSRAFHMLYHSTLRLSAVMTGQSPKDTKTDFKKNYLIFNYNIWHVC